MFFKVTFPDGSIGVYQAHNRAQLEQALSNVDWSPVHILQEPGYFPMDDEFGYSAFLHRWIYQGCILEDEEEALEIYRMQRAKRLSTFIPHSRIPTMADEEAGRLGRSSFQYAPMLKS